MTTTTTRPRRRALAALLTGGALLGTAALGADPATAAGVLPDAGNLGSPVTRHMAAKPIPFVWTLAQTFTAEHSGRVAAATAVLSAPNAACDVRYSIATTRASGKPLDVLATTAYSSVSGRDVPQRLEFTGDKADVVAGQKYALIANVEQKPGNNQCAVDDLTWAATSTPYAGGANYNLYPVDSIEYWEGPYDDSLFAIELEVADPVVTAPLNVEGGTMGFGAAPTAPTISGVVLNGEDRTATGSLPLSISDARGTGAGWNVQISATPFKNAAGKALPSSAVTFSSPAAGVCATGVTCAPAVNTALSGTLGTAATKVFSAAADSGMGNQTVTPGFTINLPAKAYKGNYSSTWVVSLVTGP